MDDEKIMKKEEKKWVYWTDRVAQEVRERVANSAVLKKIVKKKGYIVYDEKTPSGKIHVGSARGWVIHDMIAKTMRDQGMKARFILSSDDMDPFDAIPAELDKKKYENFLGIPMRNVPSPEKGYKSFADYYFRQSTDKFPDFGIEAELESTGERYVKGDFNDAIKTVLDNAEKIQKIYQKIYGKAVGSEKLPFNPICEKCGKIGTTFAYEWDSKNELVKYRCEPEMVSWAKGCGHKGEISPYDGNGKMPWKVEWAAKWPTVGVVCESAGKDHFTLGGSRSVSVAIVCEVLKFPPPWPSICEDIGWGYEFFLVGGKKMSTSKGLGTSFVEIAEMAPPQLIRFLMVKTRPETTIDFMPEGNTIPFLFNEFDKIEKIYFGLEDAEERERTNAKRVYELAVVGKIPKKKPYRIPFDFAVTLVQTIPKKNRIDAIVEILKRTGHIEKNLTDEEEKLLERRLGFAEIWAEKFAPENMKIKFEEIPENVELSHEQKQSLKLLANFLEKDRKDADLWEEIKKIATEKNIKPQQIFEAAYLVLTGKNYGPRLIPLVQSLDKNFVLRRFRGTC
jgi:lysyl-tRNA synthetase class 1